MSEADDLRIAYQNLKAERDQLRARVQELEALVAEALPLVSKVLDGFGHDWPGTDRARDLLESWLSRAKAARK